MDSFRNIIVQIARLGDLVQCWPLFVSLSRRYGSGSTALVVDEKLADLAGTIFGENQIITIPVQSMLQAGMSNSLLKSWRLARKLRKRLSTLSSHTVINLNYHRAAAVIAEAIPSQYSLGARWIDVVEGEASDAQLVEIFNANMGVRRGRRHLSDIWRDYAGCDTADGHHLNENDDLNSECHNWRPVEPSRDCRMHGQAVLRDAGLSPDVSPIAIIPGSGHHLRRWETQNWTYLIADLVRRAPVVIIGTEEENSIAEAITSQIPANTFRYPVVSLCGKTDLSSLTAILAECRLAVGVDTGSLHLAASVGTQCFGIYFGSMNFLETGPYGAGHVVVTPDEMFYPCHESELSDMPNISGRAIDPYSVLQIIHSLFTGEIIAPEGMRVYQSSLTQDGLEWQSMNSSANGAGYYRYEDFNETYTRVANAV